MNYKVILNTCFNCVLSVNVVSEVDKRLWKTNVFLIMMNSAPMIFILKYS